MTEQVQADKLASVYIKMRDKKSEIKKEADEKVKAIEADMERILKRIARAASRSRCAKSAPNPRRSGCASSSARNSRPARRRCNSLSGPLRV